MSLHDSVQKVLKSLFLSKYIWNFKLWKPLAFWLQVTNSGRLPWRQVRQMEVESGVRVLAERPAEDFEPTEEEASPECLAAWWFQCESIYCLLPFKLKATH